MGESHGPTIMRVLVTGATGYIGGRLAPLLLAQGHSVRVLVRDSKRLASKPWADEVAVVQGDVHDSSALARAVDRKDTLSMGLSPSG